MDSDPNEEDEEVIDDIDTEFEEVKEQKRPLGDDLYTTIEEAEKRSRRIRMFRTSRTHGRWRDSIYMPCKNMDDYTRLTGQEHESEEDTSLTYRDKVSSESDAGIGKQYFKQGMRLE